MFRKMRRVHLYKLPIVIQDLHPRKLEKTLMYVFYFIQNLKIYTYSVIDYTKYISIIYIIKKIYYLQSLIMFIIRLTPVCQNHPSHQRNLLCHT